VHKINVSLHSSLLCPIGDAYTVLLQTPSESLPPVKCGSANVRMFERVKCGEIQRTISANVMGKMRMQTLRYATNVGPW